MNLVKVISGYILYNHWANVMMTQWLKNQDKHILYTETPSSFSSIDLTMQHMNHAQLFWLAVINEEDVHAAKQNEIIRSGVADAVMQDLLAGSQQMINKFTAFSESELLKQLSTESMIQCRYEYIMHAINHNTHHRGQIITMIRCLGIVNNLPALDYDVYLWSVR